jgi:hypothetical protein
MHYISAFCSAAAIGVAGFLLVACQAGPKSAGSMDVSGKSAALRTMEQVAIAAQKCWFASKDAAFRPYRMANELNSFSGRPRILLVPAKHPEGRPLLVVQAEGTPARLQAFGPLMQDSLGARIGADVTRWAAGETGCGSAA